MHQALELGFTIRDTQLAADWATLLNLASQPGSSLEQVSSEAWNGTLFRQAHDPV